MSNSPIKDALAALSRNAEHVEAAALGGTFARDALPRPALAALQQASALRAASGWPGGKAATTGSGHSRVLASWSSLTAVREMPTSMRLSRRAACCSEGCISCSTTSTPGWLCR